MQEASAVVLAAWSAQNPRIMLNSATDKHAQRACQWKRPVGKYMMAHFASGTWALFDEDIQNYLGTTGAQFMSYDRYGKTSQKGAFGSYLHHGGQRPQDERSRRLCQCAA